MLWGPKEPSSPVICLLAFSHLLTCAPPPKLILGGGPNTPLHPQEEPSCLAHPGTSQDQRRDSTYVSRCRGPTAPYGHGARAPTLRRVPFAPVESARSLPAKSTRLILLT